MKRVLILMCLFTCIHVYAQYYYTEGTKWTEIRLDTLKYDSWFSDSGKPNYVQTCYYVKGDTLPSEGLVRNYKIVWQQKEEGVDSLQFLINENDQCIVELASLNVEWPGSDSFSYPSQVYEFDWREGMVLNYMNLFTGQLTGYEFSTYCVIVNIKEKSFGGCRPLKYVETDDGHILIQGIGVTSWDDYYCIFGPARMNEWLYYDCHENSVRSERIKENTFHYRSMLVHFERDGEVLYDVWPQPEGTGVAPLSVSPEGEKTAIYDLQGRRLNARPRRGLYIQGGKMRMAW